MPYNQENIDFLLQRVNSLSSFEEVNEWDNAAEIEVKSIKDYLNIGIHEEVNALQEKIEVSKNIFASKTFFQRLMSANNDLHLLNAKVDRRLSFIPVLKAKIQELEYWISVTPNDAEEAKQMLKELELSKQEIAIRKKEFAVLVRKANNKLQNEKVRMHSTNLFSSSRKLSKFGTHLHRMDRQGFLNTKEEAMSEFDYQIIEIDKMKLWIERIRL